MLSDGASGLVNSIHARGADRERSVRGARGAWGREGGRSCPSGLFIEANPSPALHIISLHKIMHTMRVQPYYHMFEAGYCRTLLVISLPHHYLHAYCIIESIVNRVV